MTSLRITLSALGGLFIFFIGCDVLADLAALEAEKSELIGLLFFTLVALVLHILSIPSIFYFTVLQMFAPAIAPPPTWGEPTAEIDMYMRHMLFWFGVATAPWLPLMFKPVMRGLLAVFTAIFPSRAATLARQTEHLKLFTELQREQAETARLEARIKERKADNAEG